MQATEAALTTDNRQQAAAVSAAAYRRVYG